MFEELLDEGNKGERVWADSAYRSEEMERILKRKGYRSCVHRKGSRNRPLGRWAKYANNIYFVVRVRAYIGLKNLAYNMRRLVYLEE